MRKQYHFWPAEAGFDAWDVDRLIELSRALPVERVAVDSIGEVDTSYWFEGSAEVPTVRKVVEHAKLMLEADRSYPIILGHDGRVVDGMHRIALALLEGRTEIDAVRFSSPLEPDYRNCQPHELPYWSCDTRTDRTTDRFRRRKVLTAPQADGGARDCRGRCVPARIKGFSPFR